MIKFITAGVSNEFYHPLRENLVKVDFWHFCHFFGYIQNEQRILEKQVESFREQQKMMSESLKMRYEIASKKFKNDESLLTLFL